MSEMVFHDLQGRVPVTRCPRNERPYSRRMPVFTKDSSMKTTLLRSVSRRNAQNFA